METFREVFNNICKEYKDNYGYSQKVLAEKLDTNLRTLQYWKNGQIVPHDASIDRIIDFLKQDENNINKVFIQKLRHYKRIRDTEEVKEEIIITPISNEETEDLWMPGFDEIDKARLRDHFLTKDELVFMFKMIETGGDREKSLNFLYPGDDEQALFKRAKFLTQWNVRMSNLKTLLGLGTPFEWERNLIPYIENPMRFDGDLEALGKKALWIICNRYIENQRNFLLTEIPIDMERNLSLVYHYQTQILITNIVDFYNHLPLRDEIINHKGDITTPLGRLWNNIIDKEKQILNPLGYDFIAYYEELMEETYKIYETPNIYTNEKSPMEETKKFIDATNLDIGKRLKEIEVTNYDEEFRRKTINRLSSYFSWSQKKGSKE